MSGERVFVLGGYAPSLVNFRGPLLRRLRASGLNTTAAAPGMHASATTILSLTEAGVEALEVPLDRTGLNPVSDLRLTAVLIRLFRHRRPSLFLGYTLKPVVFGIIAAWIARVPKRVGLITGLGYAFTGEIHWKRRIVRLIVCTLYKAALSRATAVIFQNPDDAKTFADFGLLRPGVPVHVVNGSGVDLDQFPPQPLNLEKGEINFLLIGRLLGPKGIREYAEAALIIRQRYPNARFLLAGPLDSNPDSVTADELRGWQRDNGIEWLGEVCDVRPLLALSHVFVLPSYREGTPRSVLEAMASGRPVITTDAPGCRETVIDGENGYLVPVKDAGNLALAMKKFLERPELIPQMGARSLIRVRDRYDVLKVNEHMMRALGLAG